MADSERPNMGPSDAENGVVRAEYDWSATSPSTAVIETVAAVTDRETTEIGPLYERVDPDALDAYIFPEGAAKENESRLVAFEFGGQYVTVRATGEIAVQFTD